MIVFFYIKKGGDIVILAITNENEKFIYEVCKECGEEQVQIFTGIKNLNKFAIQF